MTDPVLHVRTYRTGSRELVPVVLLHGFPFDSRMWDDVGPLLPGPRAVLAVDLPGLGASVRVLPSAPSLDHAADAVAETLRALGITRAVVAGLSMGGYVALALLERHPALVAGLGLLDTKATADDDAARANRLRIAHEVEESGSADAVRPMADAVLAASTRTHRPEVARRLAELIEDQAPAGIAWSQRAMAARPDRTGTASAYPGPALVLVGDEDAMISVQVAERLAGALVGSRLVVVPRAGHLSAVEQPAQVAEALAELAERADEAEGADRAAAVDPTRG